MGYMKKQTITILLVSLTMTFFFGCAAKKIPGPTVVPTASPEQILDGMAAQFQKSAVIRTQARFSVNSERGNLSTRIVLLAQRPVCLRIESLSIMGLPELILSSDEENVKIFSVREGKFYIAPAGQNLYRFFPISLEAREAVALVFGLPSAVDSDRRDYPVLRGQMDADLYRIDFFSGTDLKESIWLDPVLFHLRKVEKYQNGESLYKAELDDYQNVGGKNLPGRIDLHFNLPEKMEAKLRFSDSEVTKGERGDFNIDTPEGITPIYLD
jgi:outer membrane lipoprotein-sorting protein